VDRENRGDAMRRLTAAICLSFAFCAAAYATELVNWTSPGWYQVELVVFDGKVEDFFLVGGPFDSAEACEATLPENGTFEYECEYFMEKP
jgi:hypothetical protein